MNAWILVGEKSRNLKDIKKFTDRFKNKGINMTAVNTEDIDVFCDSDKTHIFVKGIKTEIPPFVISAYFGNITSHNLAVSRMLEGKNTIVINGAQCIISAGNKLETYLTVSQNMDISVPKTMLYTPYLTKDFVEKKFPYPVVLKINNGSQGSGVELAENFEEIMSLSEELSKKYNDDVLIQEYISSSKGKDLRVILCGGKFITSFVRSNSKSFKSNLSEGGKIDFISAEEKLIEYAEKIGTLLNINLGSVDFLLGEKGEYIFCEANAMPGNSYSEAAKKEGIKDPFDDVVENILEQTKKNGF